jgi:hypothetical protein
MAACIAGGIEMKIKLAIVCIVLGFGSAYAQTSKASSKSDADIKQAIIAESIASYSGSCPCPYNQDRGGRSCGKRSAYSRPGGASPVCYEQDVTTKMVRDYRVSHGEKQAPVAQTKARKSEKK